MRFYYLFRFLCFLIIRLTKKCYSEIDGVGCLYTDFIIKGSDTAVRLLRTYFLSNNNDEKVHILDQVEVYLKNELKKIFAAFESKEIVVKLFDTMVILCQLCIYE